MFGVLYTLFGSYALLVTTFVVGTSSQERFTSLGLGAIFSALPVAFGIGLAGLRSWARQTAIIYTVASSLVALYAAGRSPSDEGARLLLLVTLAWSGLVLWYFLRPSVKAQFVLKEQ